MRKEFRRFHLVRTEDVSGTSGTGIVAEGCQFSNGKVALTWTSKYHTVNVHDSITHIEAIHGHPDENGSLRTTIEWID